MDPRCLRMNNRLQRQSTSEHSFRQDWQKVKVEHQLKNGKGCGNSDRDCCHKCDSQTLSNGKTGKLACADIRNTTTVNAGIANFNKPPTTPAQTKQGNAYMANTNKPNANVGNAYTAGTNKHAPDTNVGYTGLPNFSTKIADSNLTTTFSTSTSHAGTTVASTTKANIYDACTTGRPSSEYEFDRKKAQRLMKAQFEFVRTLALINVKQSGGLLYKKQPSDVTSCERPLCNAERLYKEMTSKDSTVVYKKTPSNTDDAYKEIPSELTYSDVKPSSQTLQMMKRFKEASRGLDEEKFEQIMKSAIEESEKYTLPEVVYLSENRAMNAEAFVEAVDRTLWKMISGFSDGGEETTRTAGSLVYEQAARQHPDGDRAQADIRQLADMKKSNDHRNRRQGQTKSYGDAKVEALNLDKQRNCHATPIEEIRCRNKDQGNSAVHECLMTTIRGILADHGFFGSSKTVRGFSSLERCDTEQGVANIHKTKAHPKAYKYKVESDDNAVTEIERVRRELRHFEINK